MKGIVILILIIGLFVPMALTAQDACTTKLLQYVHEMGKMKMPEKGQTYYLKMSVKNSFRGNETKDEVINVESILSEDRMYYTSSMISVFKDTVDLFTIIHPTKTIVWYNNLSEEVMLKNQNDILAYQQNIINNSKVIGCHDFVERGGNLTKIELSPDSTTRQITNADIISIVFNNDINRIKKLDIYYKTEYPVKNQEIIYEGINYNYKGKMPKAPIRDMFFDKSGGILPKFNGYKLIDNRS